MKVRKSPGRKPVAHQAVKRGPQVASTSAQQLLDLQRAAGNRAVTQLLTATGPTLQRRLLTEDLEQAVDLRTAHASVWGRSTFGALVTAAKQFDSPKTTDPMKRQKLLERVESLGMQWLNEHKGAVAARDLQRRRAVDSLLDRVAGERARLSKQEAQDAYMADLAGGKGPADPRAKFAMAAVSPLAQHAATRKPSPAEEKFAAASGLTAAEVAAIKTFTSPDYEYINPVTSGSWGAAAEARQKKEKLTESPDWLKKQQTKWGGSTPPPGLDILYKQWTSVDQKTMVEEGTAHTGVAMSGLEKLEKFEGKAFRGERMTPADFSAKYSKPVLPTTNLSSATVDLGVAMEFALGVGQPPLDAKKEIAVILVLEDTGARDISAISEVKREKEVVLLPGAGYEFTIESMVGLASVQEASSFAAQEKVDFAKLFAAATAKGQPRPKKLVVVRIRGKHPAKAG